ncbi:MAG: tetratricopeptide repeat protein [Flavobacteriaceae bacterium]|nr:tetratricopeptide repeat protein [Flavobacteriaceae bacterium]
MNKYIKLVIAGLMIVGGIFLMFNREVGWGIVSIVLSGVPIFLFYRNEYIWLAFWKLRNQDLAKAGDWLAHISDYQKQLHRSQFGYFHYMKGLALAENPTKAETYMKRALEYGLNMKHDRALATFNLAAAALSKGNKTEAQKLLNEARKLDSAGLLTEHMNTMKNHLKMPNMQKHMHNPQMRNRGKYF